MKALEKAGKWLKISLLHQYRRLFTEIVWNAVDVWTAQLKNRFGENDFLLQVWTLTKSGLSIGMNLTLLNIRYCISYFALPSIHLFFLIHNTNRNYPTHALSSSSSVIPFLPSASWHLITRLPLYHTVAGTKSLAPACLGSIQFPEFLKALCWSKKGKKQKQKGEQEPF